MSLGDVIKYLQSRRNQKKVMNKYIRNLNDCTLATDKMPMLYKKYKAKEREIKKVTPKPIFKYEYAKIF